MSYYALLRFMLAMPRRLFVADSAAIIDERMLAAILFFAMPLMMPPC